MSTSPTSQLREVPLAACRLSAGDVTISDSADGKIPITLHARTGDAVDNYWWYGSKLVHDMSGFEQPEGNIPLDYCHREDDVVGFGEKFTAGNDGLDIAGFLTSIEPNDRADEIAKKKQKGVPYQASIYFDPRSIEELMAGASAEVNGQTVLGPATIMRKWGLYGCAVCPYGNDPGTSVELKQKLSIPRTITNAPGATSMTTTVSTAPAPAPVPAPTAAAQQSTSAATPAAAAPAAGTPADARATFMTELRRFTEAFGPQGATWMSEGKTFEEASQLHAQNLATQLAAKDTEIAELKTKLSAAPRPGEAAPVSFTAGDAHPAGNAAGGSTKLAHLGAIGKYAQSIKMPGAK